MNENIDFLLDSQRKFFGSGKTLSISFRLQMLNKLHESIRKHKKDIADALFADLGKTENESYMCEIGLSLSELSYMIKNLPKLSRDRRTRTPLVQFAAKSYVKSCPYGNVLIMSPWNYPFLLTISPLADAIAAGNVVLLKPSDYSKNTSDIIKQIIEECFPPDYIAVVTGGRKENAELLRKKFDLVFFTGSQGVGKEVLRNCAEHLTPAVLELGGKSPCIVDETAELKLTAKRIVFGKFINCGQVCVAPDYVICKAEIRDELIRNILVEIEKQYGSEPIKSPYYGKIINEKHFDRLLCLLDEKKIIFGGRYDRDRLKIEPTVMGGVDFSDPIMQDEIFGPILPILTYEDLDSLIAKMQNKQKPLALYIFSKSKKNIRKVTERISYGGGCVNDTVIHIATSDMGFGGVGESGMGAYHGKVGFDTFTHYKSIVDKKLWMDMPLRYAPYNKEIYHKIIRCFLK